MNRNELRKFAVLGAVGVLVIFNAINVLNYFLGELGPTFYWGLTVGALLGIVSCLHLSKVWDPAHLQMKDSDSSFTNNRISFGWAVPLGVLVGNIVTQFFGKEISNLVGGCTLAWLNLSLGYMAIQAWRHKPKYIGKTVDEALSELRYIPPERSEEND